jgi:RNA polymerase sigma-70 factor (TIGR02943 family)
MDGQQTLNPNNWVDKYADDLFGYAITKCNSSYLAEDFVQDTFLSALKGIANFKGNSSERTWLFSILKNKIADHYRKASTRYEVADNTISGGEEGRSFLDLFFESNGEWSKQAKPKQWSVEEGSILDDKDFQLAMQNCVGKLPANWHTAITLKYLEEKESDDICKELNVTPSNYWVIMHRAKLMLRACLEKTWFKL